MISFLWICCAAVVSAVPRDRVPEGEPSSLRVNKQNLQEKESTRNSEDKHHVSMEKRHKDDAEAHSFEELVNTKDAKLRHLQERALAEKVLEDRENLSVRKTDGERSQQRHQSKDASSKQASEVAIKKRVSSIEMANIETRGQSSVLQYSYPHHLRGHRHKKFFLQELLDRKRVLDETREKTEHTFFVRCLLLPFTLIIRFFCWVFSGATNIVYLFMVLLVIVAAILATFIGIALLLRYEKKQRRSAMKMFTDFLEDNDVVVTEIPHPKSEWVTEGVKRWKQKQKQREDKEWVIDTRKARRLEKATAYNDEYAWKYAKDSEEEDGSPGKYDSVNRFNRITPGKSPGESADKTSSKYKSRGASKHDRHNGKRSPDCLSDRVFTRDKRSPDRVSKHDKRSPLRSDRRSPLQKAKVKHGIRREETEWERTIDGKNVPKGTKEMIQKPRVSKGSSTVTIPPAGIENQKMLFYKETAHQEAPLRYDDPPSLRRHNTASRHDAVTRDGVSHDEHEYRSSYHEGDYYESQKNPRDSYEKGNRSFQPWRDNYKYIHGNDNSDYSFDNQDDYGRREGDVSRNDSEVTFSGSQGFLGVADDDAYNLAVNLRHTAMDFGKKPTREVLKNGWGHVKDWWKDDI